MWKKLNSDLMHHLWAFSSFILLRFFVVTRDRHSYCISSPWCATLGSGSFSSFSHTSSKAEPFMIIALCHGESEWYTQMTTAWQESFIQLSIVADMCDCLFMLGLWWTHTKGPGCTQRSSNMTRSWISMKKQMDGWLAIWCCDEMWVPHTIHQSTAESK